MASSPTATEAPSEHNPDIPFHVKSEVKSDGDVDRQEAATGLDPTGVQTPTVRFSSVKQEIEPVWSLRAATTSEDTIYPQQELSPEAQDALRKLSQSLQRHRSSIFTFEPLSLPPSRVPSNDSRPHSHPHSGTASPSARFTIQSPPLTPTNTLIPGEVNPNPGFPTNNKYPIGPLTMTPERSSSQGQTRYEPEDPDAITPVPLPSPNQTPQEPSTPSEKISPPSTVGSSGSDATVPQKRHRAGFSVGPSFSSDTLSPRENYSGSSTSFAKPITPHGDRDNPYARSKRTSPPKNKEDIDPRFVFSGKARHQHGRSFPNLSSMGLSRRDTNGAEGRSHAEKRSSGHWKRDNQTLSRAKEESAPTACSSKQVSMADLKRFFRFTHKSKASLSSSKTNKSGGRTPPRQPSQPDTPFADDHGLMAKKYGKLGRVLGSGAGGSVRLMRRSVDGVTFAVKQFRPRHAHESEKEYGKKVTAEFCIGSALHHGNIIETLDIVHEKGRWYEVMEFAPYDLFAMVTQARMSREEATCTFLQIFAGVTYLHSVGLAHRDLKLDNVVVNENGVMKIIDFGSATVFRYPFENDTVLAQGIVGSDPYLAPEVYDHNKYDPQPVDIWSLAIIYCCITLRRFPWKQPRMSDNAFKLFASPPDSPGELLPNIISDRPRSTPDLPGVNKHGGSTSEPNTPNTPVTPGGMSTVVQPQHHHHHHRRHRHHDDDAKDQSTPPSLVTSVDTTSITELQPSATAAPISSIRGPWRILRLLPRETRHIIGRMLQINPTHRATLQEMLEDPWIAKSPVCRQEEGGRVVAAPGHRHTLIPGASAQPEPAAKQ
ncbi:MAG: serine/threonine protein kinase [Peltula sp. TS41687]|nr:MAG: serine/threonine protein kinase [Peltula sp. TS41687]